VAEPRITGLEPDPRRPGALRVALDGRAWGAVPLEAAERLGLAAGTRLDEPALAALGAAADEEAAFRAALRHLERRAFGARDLARRLGRRGHGPDAVAAATRRLHALGLLDDAAFARQYVESRAARGRGPARLRRDLLALGVADAVADAALAAHWPEGSDLAGTTRRLAERRVRQLGALPRPVLRRRLLAYLARRGYAGRDVGRIVAEVLGERA
jgi:regulatory protein